MVKAIIDISERTNKILNIVKAKHGLRTKSDAINFAMQIFEEENLSPELKPDFLSRRRKQKVVRVKDAGDFIELSD